MDEHRGACLCGAVRFRTEGPLRGVIYCHCSQCRKQTGHYYAATNVVGDRLEIEGAEDVTWYAASDFARRGFCRHCGSALFWKPHDTTAPVDDPFQAAPGAKSNLGLATLAGTEEFPRLKVGIAPEDGRPAGDRMVGHVLGTFRAEEQSLLQSVIQRAADAVMSAVDRGMDAAMNVFNRQPETQPVTPQHP